MWVIRIDVFRLITAYCIDESISLFCCVHVVKLSVRFDEAPLVAVCSVYKKFVGIATFVCYPVLLLESSKKQDVGNSILTIPHGPVSLEVDTPIRCSLSRLGGDPQ